MPNGSYRAPAAPGSPAPPAVAAAPPWLDAAAYPFRPRAFDTGGGRLSYVDEGACAEG